MASTDESFHSGILLGVGVGVVGVFQSALPKPPDLLGASPSDPAQVESLRAAEIHALVGAAIIGGIGCLIIRSSAPLWLAAGVSGVLVGINEWTLRK